MNEETNQAPPAVPSGAEPEKKSKKGCIIGGCVTAFVVAILGIILIVVIGAKYGGDTADGPFTFSFDPVSKSELKIATDGSIQDDSWPREIGEFTYDGPAYTEGKEFNEAEIGGAVYVDQAKTTEIYVTIVPYETLEDYQRIVNVTTGEVIKDGESSYSISPKCVIFSNPSVPVLQYVFRPFAEHAAYFTIEHKDDVVWDSETIDGVTSTFFDFIGSGAPIEIGFPSYINDELHDLDYPSGPALEGGVAWAQLDPQADNFALTREGIPLPDNLSGLSGDGAAYSALDFETDETKAIELYFFPKGEEESVEDAFQRVLKAVSKDGVNVPHIGYSNFTISNGGVDKSRAVVHRVGKPDGLYGIVAFDNGIAVEVFEDSAPGSVFADNNELSVLFTQKISVAWHNATLGQ